MRLPVIGGDDARIDEAEAGKMVSYAVEHGVNYFDTAWGYHGGRSEVVTGKLLGNYPRDSFYLADKFPGYDLSNVDKVKPIFEEQLKKCGVEYFDFYLFHNVCEMNIDAYLDKKYGIFDYLVKQKDAGRIRHLGFSAHGGIGIMRRFLEAYGEHMEFCQIQLNYLDWSFQSAKEKVDLLNEYKIPIWVMEPMRGGSLASLSAEYAAKLKVLRPDEEIPVWAFRFLQTIPNVAVTISGASSLEQLKENVRSFEVGKPLDSRELDTLYSIADDIIRKIALPCTACRYCIDHCPVRLDIPNLLELYNEHCFTSNAG
jgi:predicted aldo/keto reductase-like oxidoreductase